jgi:hypothetical protein
MAAGASVSRRTVYCSPGNDVQLHVAKLQNRRHGNIEDGVERIAILNEKLTRK